MPQRKISRRRLYKAPIGDMNSRVTLYTRDIIPPVFGSAEHKERLTMLAEVWAKVSTISPYEAGLIDFDGVNINGIPTHTITIRYRSDVTSEIRIRWRGEVYEILDTGDPDKRLEYLNMKCRLLGDQTKAVIE